jgi:DNA-binding transcriptional regulator YbjK
VTAAVASEGAFVPEVAVAAKPAVTPTATVTPKPTVTPKGAVTPKGERRRYALVSAAADLLCEGGFEAVRHRAVARRAGLPLASTTYYFSSLDDLIASAVAHIGMLEVAQLRAQVATLSRRRRGPETTADLLVDLLVGSESGPRLTEQLISRYERHIACARLPGLRDIQRHNLRQRVDAVADVIDRSGRSVRPELVSALICTVDGAVVSALVDDRQDPRTVARATVIDVIDAVAPFDKAARADLTATG